MDKTNVRELQDVVIRFSGDSGDGMQLTGTLFSDTSALLGNGISTFPDYPAEIRAPQGTVAVVTGYQDQRSRPTANGSNRERRSSSTAIRSPKTTSKRRASPRSTPSPS